jgi:hypothetical protein
MGLAPLLQELDPKTVLGELGHHLPQRMDPFGGAIVLSDGVRNGVGTTHLVYDLEPR